MNQQGKPSKIVSATAAGRISTILRCLDTGVTEEELCSAFLVSCGQTKEEIVDLFLERGVPLNSQDSDGCSALHVILLNGNRNDPKKKWERRLRIAAKILQKGASANLRWNNETPLLYATNLHQAAAFPFIDLLLPYCDDWLTTTGDGLSLLHRAVLIDHLKLLHACLEHIPVDIRDTKGGTPLLYASYKGNLRACQILLKSGADPNSTTIDGVTPIHKACTSYLNPGLITGNDPMNSMEEIIEILLDAGANINSLDANGQTPLDYVIESRDLVKDSYSKRRVIILEKYGAKKSTKLPGGLA